ncbi:MAG TPA: hypothetical protein VK177_13225 [Flavobacteriales bacterium]|nr:hypothetical protein [Flavobacteriales bacterium]
MQEKYIVKNELGSLTNRTLVLHLKDGDKEIALVDIDDINYTQHRSRGRSFLSFAIAFIAGLTSYPQFHFNTLSIIVGTIILLVFTFLGVAWYIGHREIEFTIKGLKTQPIRVEMAYFREGRELMEGLKNLFEG